MDHRQGRRRRVFRLVQVQQWGSQSQGGILYNLSRDGLFVVSAFKPDLYKRATILVPAADGPPTRLSGLVIHHNGSGFGLLFQQLDGGARSFVKNCLG
jgi:hypothetical protein